VTRRPEHSATGRLALLALCGELVIAIDAMSTLAVRHAAETPARAAGDGLAVLELDGAQLPGWDLGELLGLGTCDDAWVIVELPGLARPVGFRVGRCVLVQPLPVCRALPRGVFTRRADAITAGFSVADVPELAAHVSGVVVDLARVLTDRERAITEQLGKDRRAAALEA
jgi:hypothetical protein